ncbi:MAG: hypothetical protein V3573_12395 [Desulfovibrionaceae bacterium]
MTHYDIIGVTGSLLIILAYFLLQLGKMRNVSPAYSLINLLGALLILYSLCFDFNLAAAFIESVWAVISLFGLWRAFRSRRTATGTTTNKT